MQAQANMSITRNGPGLRFMDGGLNGLHGLLPNDVSTDGEPTIELSKFKFVFVLSEWRSCAQALASSRSLACNSAFKDLLRQALLAGGSHRPETMDFPSLRMYLPRCSKRGETRPSSSQHPILHRTLDRRQPRHRRYSLI